MTELNRSHIIPGYQAAHPRLLPFALLVIIRVRVTQGAASGQPPVQHKVATITGAFYFFFDYSCAVQVGSCYTSVSAANPDYNKLINFDDVSIYIVASGGIK